MSHPSLLASVRRYIKLFVWGGQILRYKIDGDSKGNPGDPGKHVGEHMKVALPCGYKIYQHNPEALKMVSN